MKINFERKYLKEMSLPKNNVWKIIVSIDSK
jgi:hypothetical protein